MLLPDSDRLARAPIRRSPPATTLVALELDHVLIAVADLAAAAAEIEERHGLAAVEGGRHPGWGTANRIVPLGDAYLELVAVVDEAEAAQSQFGRWVAGCTPRRPSRSAGPSARTTSTTLLNGSD